MYEKLDQYTLIEPLLSNSDPLVQREVGSTYPDAGCIEFRLHHGPVESQTRS